MLTWPASCENGHVCFVDSDSNSKRRRRYSNLKRRGVAPSPKQGASGKGQGQGQNKAGGAYDSDAERNKPRRRKQRRTHRRAAETVDGTTPTVEGEGPMEDGGVGQGRVHVRHHKSHRSHGSTSHGQSTMTSARASPPKSHRSLNCYLACHVRMVWLRSISCFLQSLAAPLPWHYCCMVWWSSFSLWLFKFILQQMTMSMAAWFLLASIPVIVLSKNDRNQFFCIFLVELWYSITGMCWLLQPFFHFFYMYNVTIAQNY